MDKTTGLMKWQRITIGVLLLYVTVVSLYACLQKQQKESWRSKAGELSHASFLRTTREEDYQQTIRALRKQQDEDEKLIRRMAEYLPKEDRNYGTLGPSGKEWNDLIQERLKGRTDLLPL